MRNRMFTYTCCLLVAAGALLTGCAGPEKNAMLEEARAAYAAARSDPRVINNAPLELNKAAEALQEAENLQESGADQETVSQQAYLARQKTAIANQAAELKMAQEAIANADAERAQVLLQVRNQEAEKARRQAEVQQQELAAAKLRASELEKELAGLQTRRTERGIVLTLKNIVFELGKANLQPGSERIMDQIATFLKNHPERKIMVEGFTDNTGSADYNLILSQARADAIKQALVARGVRPDRIQTRGYGEAYPVATNDTAAGRQLNRRAEIVISNGAESVTKYR